LVSLALANVTTTGLSGLEYSTDGGQTWTAYTSGNVALDGSGKMLVRTSLTPEQETAIDNGDTLTLTATNTSGSPSVGTGTVKDDGTGTIFKEDGTEDTTIVKDDDRPLAVSSPTVNEGSPTVVFTISGSPNQVVSLALANVTTTGLSGLEYSTDGGQTWTAYTSGNVALNGSGKMLVRTSLTPEQEAASDNDETLTLTVTNTSGSPSGGTGTVKDDGTGTIFKEDGTDNTTAVKEDDRRLTVNNVTVNEGSPYVIFEVSGGPNQLVSLALANLTTNGLSGLEYSTEGGAFLRLSREGVIWNAYTSGYVALSGSGKMLVRTPLTSEQEAESDNGETLTLTATNTSGTPAVGTGTVKDDGSGAIFKEDGTVDTTTVKDDDRPITVTSPIVNERSPYVIFEVSGGPNQLVNLALANVTSTGLSGLEYSTDGGKTWTAYTSGYLVLNGSGKMLVRTSLTPEQEAVLDNGETFTLTAKNTSDTPTVGTGTIKDNGTGSYWTGDSMEPATAQELQVAGIVLDDDRLFANNDDFGPINGKNGGEIGNVLLNDLKNGNPVILSEITISSAQAGPLTVNADGIVKVSANTPAGTYTVVYTICEKLNTSNCSTATVTVTVEAALIEANMDNFQDNEINGLLGGVAGNVLGNDKLNNNPLKAAEVIIRVNDNGGMIGVGIDATGNLTVPVGAAPGTYILRYSICEVSNPANCDEAIAIVEVFHGVNLSVSKRSEISEIFEGDEFNYVISVKNVGNTDAANAFAIDILPEGLRYVSSTVNGAAASTVVSGQEIRWNFAMLAAGTVAEITLRVKAAPISGGKEQAVINTATISSPQSELSPNDNSSSAMITVKPFFIPNTITPNGDRFNDTFEIPGLGRYVSNELVIFNRMGDHVFEHKNYQNDWSAEGLVSGSYFYILKVEDEEGIEHIFKGFIQVVKESNR